MATFFTDQLSDDVKAALRRRLESGLFPAALPYGYRSVRNKEGRAVPQVDDRAQHVRRMFDLYAYGGHTIDTIRDTLIAEGRDLSAKKPRWSRSRIHAILINRAYIGEFFFDGEWWPGTHEPLVSREVFDRVQMRLGRGSQQSHQMMYASNLIRCAHCSRPITGEKKQKGGREYVYYRCVVYNAAGHPRNRVSERQLDQQVLTGLRAMKIQDDGLRELLQTILRERTRAVQGIARVERDRLAQELARVRSQKDQLLNLRLNGEIEADTLRTKSLELKERETRIVEQLAACGAEQDEKADSAIKLFELTQALENKWLEADFESKRKILEMVFLNLRLDGANAQDRT
jgi:site-specific DNA recombinase